MMESEGLVSLEAQQDRAVWKEAFSVFCFAESCHSEQVLSKQHEQGFELENYQDLDSVVIVCLCRACTMMHGGVRGKTRELDFCIFHFF